MPPRFPGFRALSSKPFEIKSSDKSYFIHSDILEARLESLCHEGTDEATNTIDLSAWDSDTVGLFAEFLYTGDYTIESLFGGDDDRGWPDEPDTDQGLLGPSDVNVFLVHATMYALAQSKNIEGLRVMAFERLKKALGGIDKRVLGGISRVTANVIELLGYVYLHTSLEEPIRDLVSKFAAENIEKLVGREEMSLLLRGEGDFAVELMEGVSGRVGDGDRLCQLEKEVQDWKDKMAASNENVRQLEAANAEKIQQLEDINTKVKQLEAENMEKVQQLENLNAKLQRLESENSKTVQQLFSANAEKVQQLTDINTKMHRLEAENTEKVQRLEAANAEKVQQLDDINAKVKMLEAENTEKAQQLEAAKGEKPQEVEAAKGEEPPVVEAPSVENGINA